MWTRRWLSTLRSKIEIERKFIPTRPILHALQPLAFPPSLPPAIHRVHPAPVHFIRDVYYDRLDEKLAAEGLWVRRRSTFVEGACDSSQSWEAKVRVGGDFTASQFVEVDGVEAVEQEIKRVLGGTGVTLEKIGQSFAVISDLTTRRLSGRLDLQNEDGVGFKLPNLTVAIDQVVETFRGDFPAARAVLQRNNLASSSDLFFHEIGELELMDEVRTDDQAPEHEKQRKTVAAEHAKHLEALMRDHPTLFPMTPRPQGKLSAYATWRKDRAMR